MSSKSRRPRQPQVQPGTTVVSDADLESIKPDPEHKMPNGWTLQLRWRDIGLEGERWAQSNIEVADAKQLALLPSHHPVMHVPVTGWSIDGPMLHVIGWTFDPGVETWYVADVYIPVSNIIQFQLFSNKEW